MSPQHKVEDQSVNPEGQWYMDAQSSHAATLCPHNRQTKRSSLKWQSPVPTQRELEGTMFSDMSQTQEHTAWSPMPRSPQLSDPQRGRTVCVRNC